MESIKFEEATIKVAENQEEYNTIHAHFGNISNDNPTPVFTVCYEFTDEEMETLFLSKKIWYQQLGGRVSPHSIRVDKPELFNRTQIG